MIFYEEEKNVAFFAKQIYSRKAFQFNTDGPHSQHIAIIMDVTGRWAQNRRLPRVAGHKEGMETVKKVTKSIKA